MASIQDLYNKSEFSKLDSGKDKTPLSDEGNKLHKDDKALIKMEN